MSMPEPQPTPMLTIQQIQQSRLSIVNNLANNQTETLILINTLADQHVLILEDVKKLRNQVEAANTKLQVANVEIKKLKEQAKKPDTVVTELT